MPIKLSGMYLQDLSAMIVAEKAQRRITKLKKKK